MEIEHSILVKMQSYVLDIISDAVIMFDNDVNITSWNKAAEKLYGWSACEAIGQNGSELLRSELPPLELQKRIERMKKEGTQFVEAIHYTKDNRKTDN